MSDSYAIYSVLAIAVLCLLTTIYTYNFGYHDDQCIY